MQVSGSLLPDIVTSDAMAAWSPTDRQVLHAVHVETIINIARNGCVNHPRLEVLGHKCLPHRFTLKVGGYGRANWQGAIHHLFSARREPTTTVYEVLQPFNFHLSPQRLLGVSAQSFRCMFWSVSVSGWFRMAGFELFWSLLVQVREGFRFRCFTGVHSLTSHFPTPLLGIPPGLIFYITAAASRGLFLDFTPHESKIHSCGTLINRSSTL